MDDNIDKRIGQKDNEFWIAKAFKEEWPTMANHWASVGAATAASAGASEIAHCFTESDALVSGIATAVDMAAYWATFFPQLLYRDRKKLADETGAVDRKKAAKKVGEYLGMFGIVEVAYVIGRFLGQYELQKRGWNPAAASATIQLSAAVILTFVYPPLRYALRQWLEK